MKCRFWVGLLVALLLLAGGTANGADYTSVVGTPNCYLRADAGITLTSGRVTTWADQSGSSNNATSGNATNGTTSSPPAYWGGPDPAVCFETAAGNFLNLPLTINLQSFSCFIVGEFDLHTTQAALGSFIENYDVFLGNGTNTPFMVDSSVYPAKNYLVTLAGTRTPSTLQLPTSGRHVIGYVGTSTTVTLYLDDQSQTFTVTPASGSTTGWTLNAFNGATTSFFPCVANYQAFVSYPSSLSTANASALIAYLSKTYKVTPTSAYKANVVCVGDSITRGFASQFGQSWVRQLGLSPLVQVIGRSLSAIQIGTGNANTLSAVAANEVDPLIDTTKVTNILIIFAGSNDIDPGLGGQTGSATYTRLSNYIAARKTAGWQNIVVCTMLPRTGDETARTAYNAAILSGAAAGGYIVADMGSTATLMGAANANTNQAYYAADAIHPNALGYSLLASGIAPVIKSFLPSWLGGTLQTSVKGGF